MAPDVAWFCPTDSSQICVFFFNDQSFHTSTSWFCQLEGFQLQRSKQAIFQPFVSDPEIWKEVGVETTQQRAGYGSNCAFWRRHYCWRILNEPMLSHLELGFYPQNQNTKTDQLITTVTQAAPSPVQFAVLLAPQRLLRSACLRAGWPGFTQIAVVDTCSSFIICFP